MAHLAHIVDPPLTVATLVLSFPIAMFVETHVLKSGGGGGRGAPRALHDDAPSCCKKLSIVPPTCYSVIQDDTWVAMCPTMAGIRQQCLPCLLVSRVQACSWRMCVRRSHILCFSASHSCSVGPSRPVRLTELLDRTWSFSLPCWVARRDVIVRSTS
jgi:hypothetical protein